STVIGVIHTQGGAMQYFRISWIAAAMVLAFQGVLSAQAISGPSFSSVIPLQRDATYEQNLRFTSGPDTAITPAKVLRWINSLMGHTDFGPPSNFEFQPIVRAHDNQQQLIAQIAYKF